MGLLDSINRQPKAIRYGLWIFVVAIPLFGIMAIVYDMIIGGDHRSPSFNETLVEVVDLCPSLRNNTVGRFEISRDLFLKNTNCIPPNTHLAACNSAPEIGHMQVRDCSDKISVEFEGKLLYSTGCGSKLADAVEFHPLYPGTGVTYIDQSEGLNAVHHAYGHIIGLALGGRHSTRENSIMYLMVTEISSSFDDIICTPDNERD